MNTLIRSLLVWLLVLALPVQGLAAAGMLTCAARHAQASAPYDAQPETASRTTASGHDHAAMLRAAGGATAMADHGDAPPDARAGGHGNGGAHQGGEHHGGGSCASCCIGAAMAPSAQPPRLALGVPTFFAVPFRAGHVPDVDPSLPDRPPRALLA